MGISADVKIPLEEENILLLPDPKDASEVISRLSNLLERKGYVKKSFCEAVLERELSLPTGFEIDNIIPSPISGLALRNATYGYCVIEVPPDMVNNDRRSGFGEGIDNKEMVYKEEHC
jgi:hypothetical protein